MPPLPQRRPAPPKPRRPPGIYPQEGPVIPPPRDAVDAIFRKLGGNPEEMGGGNTEQFLNVLPMLLGGGAALSGGLGAAAASNPGLGGRPPIMPSELPTKAGLDGATTKFAPPPYTLEPTQALPGAGGGTMPMWIKALLGAAPVLGGGSALVARHLAKQLGGEGDVEADVREPPPPPPPTATKITARAAPPPTDLGTLPAMEIPAPPPPMGMPRHVDPDFGGIYRGDAMTPDPPPQRRQKQLTGGITSITDLPKPPTQVADFSDSPMSITGRAPPPPPPRRLDPISIGLGDAGVGAPPASASPFDFGPTIEASQALDALTGRAGGRPAAMKPGARSKTARPPPPPPPIGGTGAGGGGMSPGMFFGAPNADMVRSQGQPKDPLSAAREQAMLRAMLLGG